ncbi:MAG: hypothetical protein LBC35_01045 [Coriobacteriales bacterium]|nr:hypothetical protein [Coriobacteriales bacterium]
MSSTPQDATGFIRRPAAFGDAYATAGSTGFYPLSSCRDTPAAGDGSLDISSFNAQATGQCEYRPPLVNAYRSNPVFEEGLRSA